MTWLYLSHLQNCGPCCTFREIGQCAVPVPRICRLQRGDHLFTPRSPLSVLFVICCNQFSSLVLWINMSIAAISRALRVCCPALRMSLILLTQSISRGPRVLCMFSRPWPVCAMSRLFDSQGPRLLPSRQLSQCRPWAIRLTVEDAIRLRICQYHGFSCAQLRYTMTSGTPDDCFT